MSAVKPTVAFVMADHLSYSVDGAAEAIGISKTTIWRLVQAGELRTFKIGGRTLIRADELQAFIDRKSRSAA
jgi:excisionase family DNA binding protein